MIMKNAYMSPEINSTKSKINMINTEGRAARIINFNFSFPNTEAILPTQKIE